MEIDTNGIAVPHRTWALVRDRAVSDLRSIPHFMAHPFSHDEADGARVIDVTGVPASVGDLVDAKGNVTPPEGRSGPIPDGLPAYHAGPGVVHSTANVEAQSAGNAPITDDKNAADPDLSIAQPANTEVEAEPGVAEHAETADRADEPTGFAAIDAAAHD